MNVSILAASGGSEVNALAAGVSVGVEVAATLYDRRIDRRARSTYPAP